MSEIKDRGYQCAVAEDVFNRLAGGGIGASTSGLVNWVKDERVLVAKGSYPEEYDESLMNISIPLKVELEDARYLFYFDRGTVEERTDIAQYDSGVGRFSFTDSSVQEQYSAWVDIDNPGHLLFSDISAGTAVEVYETKYVILEDTTLNESVGYSKTAFIKNSIIEGLPIHYKYGPDIDAGVLTESGGVYSDDSGFAEFYMDQHYPSVMIMKTKSEAGAGVTVTLYQEITEAPVVIPAVNLGGTWETITFTTSGGETVTKTILVKNE